MMDVKFVLKNAYENAQELKDLSYPKIEGITDGLKEEFNPNDKEALQVAKETIHKEHPELVPDKLARQLLLDCQTSLQVAFVIYMVQSFLKFINWKFVRSFMHPCNMFILLLDITVNPYLYGMWKTIITCDIDGFHILKLKSLHATNLVAELNDDIYMGGLLLVHALVLTVNLIFKIMEVL